MSAPSGLKVFCFSLWIRKVLSRHLFWGGAVGDSSCGAVPGFRLAALLPVLCAQFPHPPGVQGTHTTFPSVLTEAPAGLAGGGAAEGRRGLGQGVGR